MSHPTRRDLLKWGVAAGAAVPLGVWDETRRAAARGPSIRMARGQATPVGGDGDILDVAIVGAGVSGLYAGWRLLSGDAANSATLRPLLAGRGGAPLAVALFERSERLGGRLFSVTPPGMPSLRAELGGMRFLTTQSFVVHLVNHLGLPIAEFPVNQPINRVYLRGRHFQLRDWSDPAKVPYDLPAEFRGRRPDQLMLEMIQRFVPNAGTLRDRDWDALKPTLKADGRPLFNAGFWNLLLDTIGIEGYHFLHDALGYSGFVTNWNAVEAMQFLVADFVGNPEYRKLRDGFEALPRQFAARFTTSGGQILTHHQLRRVDRVTRDGEALLALTFLVWPEGRPLTIYARHVVLAMPRRSIELLEADTFLFANDQFLADLNAVTAKPASKIFLGYDRPWWTDLGLSAGRSLTDLPLRQCYYWGVEGDQPGADPANRNALLLASYNDAYDVDFWNEYLATPYRLSPVAVARPPEPMDPSASDAMIDEIQRQVRELHGPAARVPDPYVAYFQDWAQDPYGGAYHFWQTGAKTWEVMPRVRRPIADTNLSICGEAWSTGQGWILGALNTAERMLQDQFGLPQPDWLPADTYLGA